MDKLRDEMASVASMSDLVSPASLRHMATPLPPFSPVGNVVVPKDASATKFDGLAGQGEENPFTMKVTA